MKSNLLSDAKTAVGIFKAMRKSRKAGQEIKIKSTISVPIMQLGCGFYDTVEGCTLSWCSSEIVEASRKAFYSLAPETGRVFSQPSKDGEFVVRAFCWKEILKPFLTAKDSHVAMIRILKWYIHIKKNHKVSEAEPENAIKHTIQQTKNISS